MNCAELDHNQGPQTRELLVGVQIHARHDTPFLSAADIFPTTNADPMGSHGSLMCSSDQPLDIRGCLLPLAPVFVVQVANRHRLLARGTFRAHPHDLLVRPDTSHAVFSLGGPKKSPSTV